MVRINLLGEKVDNTAVYTLQTIAFACVLMLTAASCFVVYQTAQASLESSQKESALLDTQLQKLREKTKRVDDLEKNKLLLRDKLLTIAKLKAKKSGPVHVLADLTEAIPERAWLVAINQKAGGLEFKGLAQDPQTVSLFMKNLETKPYFAGVELTVSKQKLQNNVGIQEFALLVKLKNPLDSKDEVGAKDAKGEKGKKSKAAAKTKKTETETVAANEKQSKPVMGEE